MSFLSLATGGGFESRRRGDRSRFQSQSLHVVAGSGGDCLGFGPRQFGVFEFVTPASRTMGDPLQAAGPGADQFGAAFATALATPRTAPFRRRGGFCVLATRRR
ncbi:MAG: hypothetical protein M5R36_16200 [Deltaproteobacteria bacterium]|nr:hypothetical protein [Deltaproteobacteria bacterium]